LLPISEYPDVVPPTVVVKATYPGANPKVIAETVSAPLEEQINGVEDMMYMKSVAGSDGTLQMTITFRPGTDPSKAQVDVQNRVSQAFVAPACGGGQPRRDDPEAESGFSRAGYAESLTADTTRSICATTPISGSRTRSRACPVSERFGSLAAAITRCAFGSTPTRSPRAVSPPADVVRAIREQNLQVSAGQLGAEPIKGGADFLIAINAQGRLRSTEEFGSVVLKTGANGEVVRQRPRPGASASILTTRRSRHRALLGEFRARRLKHAGIARCGVVERLKVVAVEIALRHGRPGARPRRSRRS